MTNGDPIRRLENGHLGASLCLLQDLEIAEMKREPQGRGTHWAAGRPEGTAATGAEQEAEEGKEAQGG